MSEAFPCAVIVRIDIELKVGLVKLVKGLVEVILDVSLSIIAKSLILNTPAAFKSVKIGNEILGNIVLERICVLNGVVASVYLYGCVIVVVVISRKLCYAVVVLDYLNVDLCFSLVVCGTAIILTDMPTAKKVFALVKNKNKKQVE